MCANCEFKKAAEICNLPVSLSELVSMKLFVLSLLTVGSVMAGPLNRDLVPENAKWVLHLDGEAFLKTQLGAAVVDEKLEKHVRKAEDDTQQDFSFSFRTVTALTA